MFYKSLLTFGSDNWITNEEIRKRAMYSYSNVSLRWPCDCDESVLIYFNITFIVFIGELYSASLHHFL